jgi:hypothetical protein
MWHLYAALRAAPAFTTAAVAIIVALIAYQQWRTAQERLRLDLYNRRFEIYSKVLDFYQELLIWQGRPEQVALQIPFIKAFRESRFLFPKKSGVYNLLEEFHKNAFVVTQFEIYKPHMANLGEEGMKLGHKRAESVNWIKSSLESLEQKMAPYLDFHKL